MTDEPNCKAGRVVERYGLDPQREGYDDIHAELLALWTGAAEPEPLGYRSLTRWFNKHLLRSAYEANGRLTLGSRLDNEFETLTGDDDIARGELMDELAQEGIDASRLLEDMVSFSTIRRHLTKCLDGEKERQPAETDWEQNSIDLAADRLLEKVETALTSLENKGRVEGATDAEVSVRVQLSCPHCPTRRTMEEALRRGHVCEDHLPAD